MTHEQVLAEGRRLAAERDRKRAAAHKAQEAVIAWVRASATLALVLCPKCGAAMTCSGAWRCSDSECGYEGEGTPLRPSYEEMGQATKLSKKRISQMVNDKAGRKPGTEGWRGIAGG